MAASSETLLRDVLGLPAGERAILADELLESLDKPDPSLDAQWLEEAKSRLDAFRRGEVEAIDAEAVFAELDAED